MNILRNVIIFSLVLFGAAGFTVILSQKMTAVAVSEFIQSLQTTVTVLFAAVTALLYKFQDVHHVKGFRRQDTGNLQHVVDRKVQRLWLHGLCLMAPMLLCRIPSAAFSPSLYATLQFFGFGLLLVGILYVPFLPFAWSELRNFQADQKRVEDEQAQAREYVSRLEKEGSESGAVKQSLVDADKTHHL